jgi:hypothetical protein
MIDPRYDRLVGLLRLALLFANVVTGLLGFVLAVRHGV